MYAMGAAAAQAMGPTTLCRSQHTWKQHRAGAERTQLRRWRVDNNQGNNRTTAGRLSAINLEEERNGTNGANLSSEDKESGVKVYAPPKAPPNYMPYTFDAAPNYGTPRRVPPRRIVLVRHGQSEGNIDESEYTRTPDSQIKLTAKGHAQASKTGRELREMFDGDKEENGGDDEGYHVFLYISPYRRSKETAIGIARAFDTEQMLGVREEPQLREQDFGNFQDFEQKQMEKRERNQFGRFFYRFPNGESGADTYDRITNFQDHMIRDIDAGRFPANAQLVLCTHGLTLRLFLMRWFHWTVAEYEQISNPANSQPIVLERVDAHEMAGLSSEETHTKQLYRLTESSMKAIEGCTPEMCSMILPEQCWDRALRLSEQELCSLGVCSVDELFNDIDEGEGEFDFTAEEECEEGEECEAEEECEFSHPYVMYNFDGNGEGVCGSKP